MNEFFTKKWYPLNIIILVLSILLITVLIWGGVTNWKFIPDHSGGVTPTPPAPSPPSPTPPTPSSSASTPSPSAPTPTPKPTPKPTPPAPPPTPAPPTPPPAPPPIPIKTNVNLCLQSATDPTMFFTASNNWDSSCSGSYVFVVDQTDQGQNPLQYNSNYYIHSTADASEYLGDWWGSEDWSTNPNPDRELFTIISKDNKSGNVNFGDQFWIQTNQDDPNCFGYRPASVNWKQEFCSTGEQSIYGLMIAVAS